MIMRFDANAPLWRRLKTAREAIARGIKVGPYTVFGDLDAPRARPARGKIGRYGERTSTGGAR